MAKMTASYNLEKAKRELQTLSDAARDVYSQGAITDTMAREWMQRAFELGTALAVQAPPSPSADLRERVARRIYEATPGSENDPWDMAVERRARLGLTSVSPGVAIAYAQADAALFSGIPASSWRPPPGWKLVPDQPTETMWQAGRAADAHPGDSYTAVYCAMIGVAPSPKAGG